MGLHNRALPVHDRHIAAKLHGIQRDVLQALFGELHLNRTVAAVEWLLGGGSSASTLAVEVQVLDAQEGPPARAHVAAASGHEVGVAGGCDRGGAMKKRKTAVSPVEIKGGVHRRPTSVA